jgi:hypothetical protein
MIVMKNIDMQQFYSMRISPVINKKKYSNNSNNELVELSLAHRDFKSATGKDAPDNLVVSYDDFIKVLNYLKLKALTKTKLKYKVDDVDKWFKDIKTFETNYEPSAPFNATQKRIHKLKYKVDDAKLIIDKNVIKINTITEFENKTDEEKEIILNIMSVMGTKPITDTALQNKKEVLIQQVERATKEFSTGNEVIKCLNQ